MTTRSTTIRDRHRKVIARDNPPCGLCGTEIDYTLRYPDLLSYVVDHVIPIGPNPTPERIAALDVIENKQAAHSVCNRAKSDKLDGEQVPAVRTFVTARSW